MKNAIAIVGMSCRFPGAKDLAGYWDVIRGGRSHFREIPGDRWNHELFYSPGTRDIDKAYARKVGFIDDIWSFPALHYGMAPLRVKVMDPQHRLLVEASREALADAGYEARELPRRTTAVFIGASVSEHKDLATTRLRAHQLLDGQFGRVVDLPPEVRAAIVEDVTPIRAFSIAGNLLNMMAATVAQTFDLGGAAFTIDSACSSSLVAAAEAVAHLRSGMADVALVGGVYLNLTPDNLVGFSRIGAISKSDACRPFDADADGFVLGEGVGVVVLKRLDDARRDGDRVYAVIRGAGVNNDGRGDGPMTPRQSGQVDVLRRAYEDAGVTPDTVGFIEAHGTATGVGDVVELGALREYYEAHAAGPIAVAVSSVKANIGHTMSAAGVAGLIKAALVLSEKTIPRQAAYATPNPTLGLDDAWSVPTEERPFAARDGAPRRAAVSSFGFGGTNVHLVLEEEPAAAPAVAEQPQVVLVSAPAAELLARHLEAIRAQVIAGGASVAEVAATLALRRREAAAVGFVATTRDELLEKLAAARDAVLAGAGAPGLWYAAEPLPPGERRLAFLLPGQGAQALDLCRALYDRFPAFRARLDGLAASVGDLFERPLLSYLYAEQTTDNRIALTDTEICQPIMAALGLALAGFLVELGVAPDVVLGHSLGELAAAGVAGLLTPEAALRFVAERGRIMRDLPLDDPGAMAAVAADRARTAELIAGIDGVVAANLNHPAQTVISGTTPAVEAALERCAAAKVQAQKLVVSHAFHSPLMAGATAPLERVASGLTFGTPTVPLVSCIDVGPYPAEAERIRDLLVRHATSPVDFASGVRAAGARVFVQVGAGGALLSMARGALGGAARPRALVSVASVEADDTGRLAAALAELAVLGVPVRLDRLAPGARTTWLPATPLATEEYRSVVRDPRPPLPPINTEPHVASNKDSLVALFREQLAAFQELTRRQMDALGVKSGELGSEPRAESREQKPKPAGAAAPPPRPVPAAAPPPPPPPQAQSADSVESRLLDIVSQVSAFPRANLRPEQRLVGDLGFDSLMVVELAGKADAAFPGLGALPKSLFVNDPTVKAVAEHVARALRASGPAATATADVAAPVGASGLIRHTVTLEPQPLAAPAPGSEPPWTGGVTVIPGSDPALATLVAERLIAAGRLATVAAEPPAGATALLDLRGLDPAESLRAPVERLLGLVRGRGPLAMLAVAHRGLAGSALAGFAKALAREQPAARVKALAFDDGAPRELIAASLVAELLSTDATVDVSYAGGVRRVAAFRPASSETRALPGGVTVAITGGTRGIGAKLAVELARRHRARLALLGRSVDDAALAAIRAAGGEARFIACDVTDAASLRAALASAGPVELMVHAAGVLADAPVAKKSDADLARVFDTKVAGVALLDAAPAPPRTLLVLGSWAGRFGNASQTDYAAANHLVATYAAGATGATRVVTVDLPPWDDSAMVRGIPGPVKAAMRAAGVPFVDDATGLDLLCAELAAVGPSGETLVGPAELAAPREDVARFRLSVDRQPWLGDHRINGTPVLPLAAAASLALDAATRALGAPARLTGLELTGGVRVAGETVVEARATAERGVATVELVVVGDKRASAYRATGAPAAGALAPLPARDGDAPTLTVEAFYRDHTFHGPRLRGITRVTSISSSHVHGAARAAATPDFTIDPVLLDSALQLAGFWGAQHGRAGLPLGLGELRLLGPLGPGVEYEVRLALEAADGDLHTGHVDVLAPGGAPVVQLRGVRAELVKRAEAPAIDRASWDIAAFPEVVALRQRLDLAQAMGIENPYFHVHQGICADTSVVDGREKINYSSYNYLGMSGDEDVSRAVAEAVARYGTSVSASRVASGERPLHHELESAIARFLGCEDAIVMVGGHATNVGVIGHLVGPGDLIVHDSLAHDSIMGGARLSGAKRRPFPHNDVEALDRMLTEIRGQFRRVLIAIEGTYSMDGDVPRLDAFVAVKRKHHALMLVDEAHSFGVLGKTGRGIGEHHPIDRADVDLWMGTLSKTLASCGGYIAGSHALVEWLKYTCPAFVYSVGISPANAAAALAALRKLEAHPEIVDVLRARSALFLELLKARGINTGMSEGTAVVPCIVGNSYDCLRLATNLGERGINVQPILYPAVEEHLARLRFFITSKHTEAQLRLTAEILAEELGKLNPAYLAPPPPQAARAGHANGKAAQGAR